MAKGGTSLEFTLRGRVVGWLAALAAGAAWIGGDPNARLAAALLAAPLLVDFLLKPRRLHRTSFRTGPRRTTAGVLFVEHFAIEHPGRWPLRECLLLEPRTMRSDAPKLLPPLPGGKSIRIEVHARSKQRSRALERVFVLESSWPLALLRARAAVTVRAEIVTEPARIELAADVTRRIADRHSTHEVARMPFGPEFHSLREHLLGEDARRVHARRSAATGVLVRRIDHGSTPDRVGVVLDLRRPAGSSRDRRSPRFEWGMSACASLVAELRRKGSRVVVFVLGCDVTRHAIDGTAAERELLTMLAEARSVAHRTLTDEHLALVRRLDHCFWIPAGTRGAPAEAAALGEAVQIVEDSRE